MSQDLVELWFLRHAHAGDPARWKGDDAVRPLSAKGREQAERLAHFLVDHGHRPDVILSSPRLRAAQTADAVARAFEIEVRLDVRLAGALDLTALDALIGELGREARRVMLVGHDPDFSQLVSELTGTEELIMRKGSLARVDVARPATAGGGALVWLVPPPLLDPAT